MARVRCQELPAETHSEFVDQRGIERIGVSESDDLVSQVEWVVGTKADAVLRESGACPWHTVIAVLDWIIEPLAEELALGAPFVVDFERNVVMVLAAADRAAEV